MAPIALTDIARFLAEKLTTNRYSANEQGGIFKPSNRPVQRLGLALEPFPDIGNWVKTSQFDALWLHRPWQLPPDALPNNIGILYHHLPFDEHLTMGYSPAMAEALDLQNLQEIGYKQSLNPDGTVLAKRPIGMLAEAPTQSFEQWQTRIVNTFGGYEDAVPNCSQLIDNVAVIGAMNESLVREAAERGATLCLTGQYRPSTKKAVQETGMAIIAVGHRRSEEWGLRALKHLLEQVAETSLQPGQFSL